MITIEQINEIKLTLVGNRSAQMRALFELGATRQEVENILDYHNKGAIYNIWKAWSTGTPYGRGRSTRRAARVTENIPYTYGIEIEYTGVSRDRVAETIQLLGLNARTENYNRTNSREHLWHIKHDGSVTGSRNNQGGEVVSPVLRDAEGVREIEKICWALDAVNAHADRSTGLHFHIGAATWEFEQYRNAMVNYAYAQKVINSFMPTSRCNYQSGYCMCVTTDDAQRFSECTDIRGLMGVLDYDRYHTVNPVAWNAHKTIEFRQHQGTTNYIKIRAWLEFLQQLCAWSKDNVLNAEIESINDIPWLTETQKEYFKFRAQVVRRG